MNNLAAEPGDFDAVRAKTRAAWQKALGAVEIAADTPMRTTMYTALYHSLIAPSVSSAADGRWRGPDNAVHKAAFTMHSTFSLWATFRPEHPLLTLVQLTGRASGRERVGQYVKETVGGETL